MVAPVADETLLSHLIRRFGLPPEYLATEALGFILDRSPACGEALRDLAAACRAAVGSGLVYRTQQVDERGARPDIVGSPRGGRPQVILEGKFWASLTENQPQGYLDELVSSEPGILFMVVPAARMATLWPEVWKQCTEERAPASEETCDTELLAATLNSGHVLAMVSWRVLLARLAIAAEAARESRVREDIAQLESLCEAQDGSAFLPIRLEDLTDQTIPRRVAAYHDLARDIVQEATTAGFASRNGLRAGGAPGRFGPYLALRGWGASLAVALDLWAAHGIGPLWLCFQDWWWPPGANTWVNHPPFQDAIRGLSPLTPRGRGRSSGDPVLVLPSDGRPAVALALPVGVERHVVVSRAVTQLRRVHDLLPAGGENQGRAAGRTPAEIIGDEDE
jgi:hypothetical protein